MDIEEVLRLDRKVFRSSLGADLAVTASSRQEDEEVFFLIASTRARSSDEDISAKTLGLDFYLIDSLGQVLWQHSLSRYEYSSEFSPQFSYLDEILVYDPAKPQSLLHIGSDWVKEQLIFKGDWPYLSPQLAWDDDLQGTFALEPVHRAVWPLGSSRAFLRMVYLSSHPQYQKERGPLLPTTFKLQDLLLGPNTLLNDAQGGVIYSFQNSEFKPWLVAPTFKGQSLLRGNRPLPDVLCQVNSQSLWGVGYETKDNSRQLQRIDYSLKTGLAYLAATFPFEEKFYGCRSSAGGSLFALTGAAAEDPSRCRQIQEVGGHDKSPRTVKICFLEPLSFVNSFLVLGASEKDQLMGGRS